MNIAPHICLRNASQAGSSQKQILTASGWFGRCSGKHQQGSVEGREGGKEDSTVCVNQQALGVGAEPQGGLWETWESFRLQVRS